VLFARGLVMEFPPVRALDGVDFDVRAGEVHALMGENGAGKSTLIKVLSGLYRPVAGMVRIRGKKFAPGSPREAEAAGVSTVFQEIDLVPTLSVADNVCLGRYPRRLGMIRRGKTRARAEAALARLDLRLDVSRALAEYPIAIRQMVAIARALDVEARVLILDEPTSSLDARETRELFGVLRRLRSQGLGIVFVTHFLEQVYEIADRITVLRNGALVGSWNAAALSKSGLVEAMTGKTFEAVTARERKEGVEAVKPVALEFRGLGRRRGIEPSSGVLRSGETLGLAGLLGSGRTELARLLFGADAPDSGEVLVGRKAIRRGSVRRAIAAGIAFTPDDRKAQGLVLELSVRENIVLALQARRGALRPVPRGVQARLAEQYIRALKIRTPGAHTPVGNLSGGNQQKVLLARWLAVQPSVLILDEPTRGIDVGARAEIEALVEELRAKGAAVVFISAELDELVRTCGRLLVLRDRRVVGELVGDDVEESRVLGMIAGGAA
jgi:simple sugar transport system ATP-binding protein